MTGDVNGIRVMVHHLKKSRMAEIHTYWVAEDDEDRPVSYRIGRPDPFDLDVGSGLERLSVPLSVVTAS